MAIVIRDAGAAGPVGRLFHARSGTAHAGPARRSTPVGSSRLRSAVGSTGCCGVRRPDGMLRRRPPAGLLRPVFPAYTSGMMREAHVTSNGSGRIEWR
ncbi:hypothetical protein Acel_1901 [Acidothermus cellulolyticus 11B]|uniref:Uncharacterized protein n=1 Tax=Acidothermus cellulolyticus (strain ATCC 43068 / DSM 8971 / 11B) TaxID=351607 RepID=A0LW63_ACIC1|nr:hypothetical protein Acel_1901 [Acidothermus cellulolyticus 11B]